MRSLVLPVLMSLVLTAPAAAAPPNKLDHILLWGRSIDQVTAVMAVKLGFQVRPGRDPAGVANRFVRLPDQGYIELLGVTRPNPEFDPGMVADRKALKGGPGSRSIGIHSADLDADHARLKSLGYVTTQVFAAGPNDPDGGGPSAPPRWRLFAFDRQPLSANSFYIAYAADKTGPADPADDQAARRHPNGARALSAFWLLSADAHADVAQLERMGFAGARPVRLPQVVAKGYCVPVGPDGIFALEPDGPGIAADALRTGGPQVLGVSIAVADLSQTKRRVERGYERPLTGYDGVEGASFLAPTQADLGLFIEFHAMGKGPCGGS